MVFLEQDDFGDSVHIPFVVNEIPFIITLVMFAGPVGGQSGGCVGQGGGAYKSVQLQSLHRSPGDRRYRDPAQGPLRKLSVDLIKTYKHINEVQHS